MATLGELERRVKQLEKRNTRVDSEKAWETSYARRILLVLFTYLAVGFYLRSIGVSQPWINAVIPAIAFMLSTLTLPFFRRLWLQYMHKAKGSKP